MWSGSQEPFHGRHYELARTLGSPQPLQRPRPYLMIAGGGETKTLRLVAQYADACNLGAGPGVPHKLEVLRRHCDAVGRDEAEIERTVMLSVGPQTSRGGLLRQLDEAAGQGCSAAYVYAQQMPEPGRVLDLLGSVVEAVR